MQLTKVFLLCLCGLLMGVTVQAAEIIFPQNRTAFFSDEPIEIAVAALAKDAAAKVEIIPATPTATALAFTVTGTGSTITSALPPLALAPGKYRVQLDGVLVADLTIASGVWQSSMLVGQAGNQPEGGANFVLGNTFSWGLLDQDGQPQVDMRGKKSGTSTACEQWLAADRPVINYMYLTGYVLHKPFGTQKSWANDRMMEAIRLMSFAEGQRLRKYGKAIYSVGPIDEPGLSWGATPAGGMASGFPNWDEQPWYEQHGWKYTQDIAAGSDAEWMKYLTARCAILKDTYVQASKDIKASFPSVKYAGDLYALSAVMDGTDSLNQTANDIPTSHVFFDWFGGPLAVTGQLYLEKAFTPTAKIAHAMNGQLQGTPANPMRPLYNTLMNGMLQAGLKSNWWLNYPLSMEDLLAVNEPAARVGPLFLAMTPGEHDVALMWGFTELALRQKDMAARESKKGDGQQIKLMVPLPDKGEMTTAELDSNAYEVGYTYVTGALNMHQTLRRAGYPTHFVDERLLPTGILKNYKTLVIVGQTFPLPADVMTALAKFHQAGGTIIVDKSTTVNIPGAVVCATAEFSADTIRAQGLQDDRLAKATAGKREASKYESMLYLTEPIRAAVAPVKAALAQSKAQPAVVSDNLDLSVERHVGGAGALYMVLNGHEAYPDGVADDTPYPRYNPAPAKGVTFTLRGIKPGSVVYAIEGLDWKTIHKLEHPGAPQTVDFAAGEMKLYLVAPSDPSNDGSSVTVKNNTLTVTEKLGKAKMPWPQQVTITRPDDTALYSVYRATDANGVYTESFPLGANAMPGSYKVVIDSLLGNYRWSLLGKFTPSRGNPRPSPRPCASSTSRPFANSWPANPPWSSPSPMPHSNPPPRNWPRRCRRKASKSTSPRKRMSSIKSPTRACGTRSPRCTPRKIRRARYRTISKRGSPYARTKMAR